ncbi:MAG TPA: glycosyltransferase family 39 protein [Urbifossiella sp.]|nr:glycosyltransferase family 39 protein [Urbifossiella sp.]
MPGWFRTRAADYALLLCAAALLTLPNLGASSLWDVDEGVNAEAGREMREADSWVVPTFNFELRTQKPVMQYWLLRLSYAAFGVSEWSARLPSVLCGWLTILLTYELTRRMFGRATGLLAGIVLASAVEFCVLAHAATPDAPLLLFTVLTYLLFWVLHANSGRGWWVPTAAACGLAALSKGPVGVAVPGLVFLLYFAWNGELRRLLDRRLGWAVLTLLLVAAPWYGLVAAETRGAWPKAFFLNENVNRALTPMENHSGPIFYHAAALLVLFAPWSAVLVATLWYAAREARVPSLVRARRLWARVVPGRLVAHGGRLVTRFTARCARRPRPPLPPVLVRRVPHRLFARLDEAAELRPAALPGARHPHGALPRPLARRPRGAALADASRGRRRRPRRGAVRRGAADRRRNDPRPEGANLPRTGRVGGARTDPARRRGRDGVAAAARRPPRRRGRDGGVGRAVRGGRGGVRARGDGPLQGAARPRRRRPPRRPDP